MFEKLKEYEIKIKNIEHLIKIVSWDLRISTPNDEKDDVIKLIGELENKLFSLKTEEEYGSLLKEAIESGKLELEKKLNYEKVYRNYLRDTLVPKDFYVKFVTLKEKCVAVWEEAKEKDNYKLFEPYLREMIEKTKEYYRYFSDGNLYDAMLNEYEYGLTQEIIDPLFEELKKEIIPLIKKLKKDKKIVKMEFQEDSVMECAKVLLDYIGFDMNRGALGFYSHGFTEKIDDNDVRITFKKTDNVIDFVTTIIHEGGHGIFEQGMKDCSIFEYLGSDSFYALHESQSRFYENMLGRNKNFWIPIYDKVKEILNLDCDIDTFNDALNDAGVSFIRVEADELTYCLHIILRYEIEKDIFNNQIKVEDLPRVWKEKTKEYLGLDVIRDRDGIIQDMHWSDGSFGYFPSYLMGSIYDGMLLEHLNKELGSVNELLRDGKVKEITEFLSNNIYKYGGTYTGLEVLNRLGIEKVSVEPLVNYFKEKYERNEENGK